MSSAAQTPTMNGAEQVGGVGLYNPKCKICKSSYRAEIDALILSGARYADIRKFVGEQGVTISESSISRHRSAHTLAPGSLVSKSLGDLERVMRIEHTHIMQELGSRDVSSLTTAELLTHGVGTGGLLVMLRSLTEELKRSR